MKVNWKADGSSKDAHPEELPMPPMKLVRAFANRYEGVLAPEDQVTPGDYAKYNQKRELTEQGGAVVNYSSKELEAIGRAFLSPESKARLHKLFLKLLSEDQQNQQS